MSPRNMDTILEQGMSEPCTCAQLRKAARAVTLLYDDAFKSSGLLSTQLGVLHTIYNSESIKITHLAKEIDTDRTTLTRNLAVLERRGFVNISSGEDHRTRIVTISNKGRNAVGKAIPLWSKAQHKVREEMGENAWRNLMENLSLFVKAADRLAS